MYFRLFEGILMTVAWMFFAVLGIFMARFYKLVWPEGMEWCEQKRWFIVRTFIIIMPPFLEVGCIALHLSVGQSIGQSVDKPLEKS